MALRSFFHDTCISRRFFLSFHEGPTASAAFTAFLHSFSTMDLRHTLSVQSVAVTLSVLQSGPSLGPTPPSSLHCHSFFSQRLHDTLSTVSISVVLAFLTLIFYSFSRSLLQLFFFLDTYIPLFLLFSTSVIHFQHNSIVSVFVTISFYCTPRFVFVSVVIFHLISYFLLCSNPEFAGGMVPVGKGGVRHLGVLAGEGRAIRMFGVGDLIAGLVCGIGVGR